jgi:hypothetical protein
MNVQRFLRPAQKIMIASVVAFIGLTGAVSATTSSTAAHRDGATVVSATREYQAKPTTREWTVGPNTREWTVGPSTREW